MDWEGSLGWMAEARRQGREAPDMEPDRLAEVAAVLASGDGLDPPDEVEFCEDWADLVIQRVNPQISDH